MLTGFFQDSDFIVVLQTGFGSGFLPLGSGLESDLKKLESEHLWWCPAPHLKYVPPISCLVLRLLHTSNIVFKNVPPFVVFAPPATKSREQA